MALTDVGIICSRFLKATWGKASTIGTGRTATSGRPSPDIPRRQPLHSQSRGSTLAVREGVPELAADPLGAVALLENPYAAGAIGLALGVGLLLLSRRAAGLLTADDPALGVAKVAVAMLGRMLVVLAALGAYHVWARQGLVPFGAALLVGFMITVTVEVFGLARMSHQLTEGGR